MDAQKALSPLPVMDLANAYFDSCVLFASAELGVYHAIDRLGPASRDSIAADLGLNPRGASLLLDACVAVGLLTKTGETYQNTPASGAFLIPGKPGDLTKAIRFNQDVYGAWQRLADLARTGEPVESPKLHLGGDRGRTRRFVLSMHGRVLAIGRPLLMRLNLAGRRQLFDVGGGPGTYAVLISQANPGIRCTVLDLPEVIEVAKELISQQGAAGKVVTMAGDYHTTPFPAGNDVVNFFGVLHQESPDSIRDLFKKAYSSMVPGGAVYVMDMMTDETHTAPKFSALFALTMALTTNNGWVFSRPELQSWLTEAGFVDVEFVELAPLPHCLASARKPLA
jgi:3-hydroxy-5-methyl-1-naphthoate 3-O-methyltransferase